MNSLKIKNDIYWVGALDPNLRVFDIIMYTPYGTTYNSYVVKGSDKVALFETVKVEFFEEYISRLKDLDIEISNIDYIVVDHTEPDHAGSVAKILELSPNAKVVGSPIALKYLKQILNIDFESISVTDGDSLSLGNKTLKFISAPFLHWPDSMYTYIEEDNTLVTCDSFGSHYSFEGILNSTIDNEENYMEALKYYYNCIMGPYKPFVLKALNKIKDLKIDTICPGHGPVLVENPQKIMDLYREWSTPEPKNNSIKTVVIPYVSAYGYTEEIAKSIADGIRSCENINVKLYNITYSDINEILNDINSADGILFGSPTIVNELLEPVRELMTKLNPIVHGGKLCSGFGSYGWSGEAVPRILSRLKELKMNIFEEGFKVNFRASTDDLKDAKDFGARFGSSLKSL
ncbi:MAG: FprA family A-type flavoprotein [Clostridium sp.]